VKTISISPLFYALSVLLLLVFICEGVFIGYVAISWYFSSESALSMNEQKYLFVGALALMILPVFWLPALLKGAYYVGDAGDYLLIKKIGMQKQISFDKIKHINRNGLNKAVWLTIEFIVPNDLGKKVSFISAVSIFSNKNEVFENLKDRVYKAHTEGGKLK